jgi:purine-binding chemotaxis protein CheW
MQTETLARPRPPAGEAPEMERLFVSFTLAGQLCGIPALAVRDVLGEQTITRMPLAPPEIAGSLNLRGRIVTAIDLRARLRLPPAPQGEARMSVVTDQGGELYAFLVDQVSAVMNLPASSFEPRPPSLPLTWAAFSPGAYRLDSGLLVELDVARLLAFGREG